MKFRINLSIFVLIAAAFTSTMFLSSCNNDDGNKCCEGYTGKVTDPRADSLVNRCHFISKDSIERWVGRYESYKQVITRQQGYKTDSKDTTNAKVEEIKTVMDEVSKGFLLSGSVSYNNCIIKKILCDKNSIGLRVLYGIGGDNKIHIMLVGIQPDYSNLYIDGSDCCGSSLNKQLGAGATGASGVPGGAEYGQLP